MRRVLTLLAALVVVTLVAPPAWASGWRQNDFNAGRTRYNSDEETLTSDTVAGVQLAWKTDLSARGGVAPTNSGPPILAHGTLYVAGERRLRALDAATGSVLWDRGMNCGRDKAVSGGVLVVSCTDGLAGLDPATGHLVWSRRRLQLFDTAYLRGFVYGFYVRTDTPSRLHIAKVDVQTGAITWTRAVSDRFVSAPMGLTVDGGTVYISSSYGSSFAADRGRLFGQHRWLAFDAATGATKARMACRVRYPDGSVYIVNEEMCALDVATERMLWMTDRENSGPAVTRRSAISNSGSWDIATGNLNFRLPGSCQDPLFNPLCRPLVAGDVIYSYDDDDYSPAPQHGLMAVDLSSGEVLTRIDLPPTAQVIVADGSIFATVADGVQAWRLP
jgi:outer membrane protein assembly factor BamB